MTPQPTRRGRRQRRRSPVLLAGPALVGLAAVLLAGCVSPPSVTASSAGATGAGTASASATSSAAASAGVSPSASTTTCNNVTASYPPKDSSAYAEVIRTRGVLVVGVSADTLLLGAADPVDPKNFKGFDIDQVRAVAQALWPSDTDLSDNIQFKVITAGDRIPQLTKDVDATNIAAGGVDLVARVMTITCDRWTQVAFSAPYLGVSKRLLVPTGSVKGDGSPSTLPAGMRICAPSGTTSIQGIDQMNGGVAVGVPFHTDCLALLQQKQVDAITGDDVILAGFRAQDPYTEILDHSYTEPQYAGLGINSKHKDFVQFVNSVLEKQRASGAWQKSYDFWLKEQGGLPEQTMPKADYSRPVGS